MTAWLGGAVDVAESHAGGFECAEDVGAGGGGISAEIIIDDVHDFVGQLIEVPMSGDHLEGFAGGRFELAQPLGQDEQGVIGIDPSEFVENLRPVGQPLEFRAAAQDGQRPFAMHLPCDLFDISHALSGPPKTVRRAPCPNGPDLLSYDPMFAFRRWRAT